MVNFTIVPGDDFFSVINNVNIYLQKKFIITLL